MHVALRIYNRRARIDNLPRSCACSSVIWLKRCVWLVKCKSRVFFHTTTTLPDEMPAIGFATTDFTVLFRKADR